MARSVLILSWEYPPIVEGGLARHVEKLAEHLVDQGSEVHVLTRGGVELGQESVRTGVMVHRVCEPPCPRESAEAFVEWVSVMNSDMVSRGLELIERFDFDVVHSHDWLVADAAQQLSTAIGSPWITTVHATEYGRHQGWVQNYPQSHIHAAEEEMVRTADHVVTCSEYMRTHVAEIFEIDARDITVIPNGIDPSDMRPCADELADMRARYASSEGRLVLLVGRLVFEKGFQVALEALPTLIQRMGNVRFLVAGSGTHGDELKAQAVELGVADQCEFLGWTDDGTLHALYRIADLCVVPSLYEPFGLVALEAMASGCPCIVADTGGLCEVVPNETVGLRFRSRDAGSLAGVLERALTDEALRADLIAQAHEHVLSFDWADVARQASLLYSDSLSALSGAPSS